MDKNDSLHILSKTLSDTLPYEYGIRLTDNETTIVLGKEDSDCIMYISTDKLDADAFEVVVGYDDNEGICKTYETFHWVSKDDQIPLATIIADIKYYFS